MNINNNYTDIGIGIGGNHDPHKFNDSNSIFQCGIWTNY